MRRVISSSTDEASPPSSTDEASPPSSTDEALPPSSTDEASPPWGWAPKEEIQYTKVNVVLP